MNGESRRDALRNTRLYVVTDSRDGGADLERFLDAVLGAGVGMVQLRDKTAEAGDLLRHSLVFRRCADRHGALFILNDRPDVALAAGADGAHLGQNDLPVPWARRLLGPDLLLGLSTRTTQQFEAASADADYLCVGPVHATPTKPGREPVGIAAVRHAAERAERRPWFAIGGIDASNIGKVVAAGAERVVVVRAVTLAADPAAAVKALLAALA